MMPGTPCKDRNEWEQRKYIERVRGNPDLADFFHAQQKNGPFRVETQTEEIHSNWGDYHDARRAMRLALS